MRPLIIGVGGAGSGSGKTFVAEHLLRRLRGFGALKCTRTELYTSVVDDATVLGEEGKDTARLIEAGASEVLWVRSTPEGLPEALEAALGRLGSLSGVIVEGNGAIEVLKPDIVIFIFGGGGEDSSRMKEGSERVLGMAHVVITDGPVPEEKGPGDPGGVKRAVFGRGETAEYVEYIERAINEREGTEADQGEVR